MQATYFSLCEVFNGVVVVVLVQIPVVETVTWIQEGEAKEGQGEVFRCLRMILSFITGESAPRRILH
jgi:hypothetical protein